MTCNMGVNGGFGLNVFNLNFNHIQHRRCYDPADLNTPPHHTPLLSRSPPYGIFELTAANVPILPRLWPVIVPVVIPTAE